MFPLRKRATLVLVLTMMLVFIIASGDGVEASALTANWTVAVTYQNLGNADATLAMEFFPEGDSTGIQFDPMDGAKLPAGAGRSFWIGNVGALQSGFLGNAVMSADQPLSATAVQFSNDPGFRMRMLYNGFSPDDIDSQYLVPTVLLNKFGRTSIFSIQNAESEAINATVRFYDADNSGNLASTIVHNIPANSSKFVEMNDSSDTGLSGSLSTFNGSAIITAEKVAGGDANVAAAVNELYTNRNVGASFEGLPLARAANTIYMATGLCEQFHLDTFYAVSNASLTGGTAITVEYKDTSGVVVATDGPYNLGAGEKKSIITCSPSDGTDMSGFSGSAKITAVGEPIAAVGKAQNSSGSPSGGTADVFTAFLGEPQGVSKLAISFVRFANDSQYFASNNTGGRQRTFLAIQNLENAPTEVDVKYNDKNGNTVATQTLTIQALAKGNSNAKVAGATGAAGMVSGAFGYYTDGSFGAGVVIEATSANPTAKFIAVARTNHPGAGEDVNAVPAP